MDHLIGPLSHTRPQSLQDSRMGEPTELSSGDSQASSEQDSKPESMELELQSSSSQAAEHKLSLEKKRERKEN